MAATIGWAELTELPDRAGLPDRAEPVATVVSTGSAGSAGGAGPAAVAVARFQPVGSVVEEALVVIHLVGLRFPAGAPAAADVARRAADQRLGRPVAGVGRAEPLVSS